MVKKIRFTHLLTSKSLTVLDHRDVKAIIHGDVDKTHLNAVWLILSNVPAPIPVKETEAEVEAALDNLNKE